MPREWEELFFYTLTETGNVSQACRIAGISRQTAYDYRETDHIFAWKWEDCLEEACDGLELEARRRAVEGVERKKFSEGRPVMDPATGRQYVEREYSDTLLIVLLKAHRPEKFRESKFPPVEVLLAGLPPEDADVVRAALNKVLQPR